MLQQLNWSYYQFKRNLPYVYIVLLIARADTDAFEAECAYDQKEWDSKQDKSDKFLRSSLQISLIVFVQRS